MSSSQFCDIMYSIMDLRKVGFDTHTHIHTHARMHAFIHRRHHTSLHAVYEAETQSAA